MAELHLRAGAGKPQRRAAAKKSFTAKKRQAFLDALAQSCNVSRSARYAGVCKNTVYIHRRADAVFAEQWVNALAMGYHRLEALVLEHGGAGEALDDPDPDRVSIADMEDADEAGEVERAAVALPPFDWDRAFKILQHHHRQPDGRVPSGHRPAVATREETNAALLKALAAAKRRVERGHAGG